MVKTSLEEHGERVGEKILNSLLESIQELEFPTEAEVQNMYAMPCTYHGCR